MKLVFVLIVLCSALATYSYARLSRTWTHEERLSESDFVSFVVLKRSADGRCKPLTGQEDPDESFYEVHRPFLLSL
jgi:hypothetical protein